MKDMAGRHAGLQIVALESSVRRDPTINPRPASLRRDGTERIGVRSGVACRRRRVTDAQGNLADTRRLHADAIPVALERRETGSTWRSNMRWTYNLISTLILAVMVMLAAPAMAVMSNAPDGVVAALLDQDTGKHITLNTDTAERSLDARPVEFGRSCIGLNCADHGADIGVVAKETANDESPGGAAVGIVATNGVHAGHSGACFHRHITHSEHL